MSHYNNGCSNEEFCLNEVHRAIERGDDVAAAYWTRRLLRHFFGYSGLGLFLTA